MKTRTLLLFSSLALTATAVDAELRGRLDPTVRPGMQAAVPLQAASPELLSALPAPPPDGARAWSFSRPLNIKGTDYQLLVLIAGDTRTLWLDRDRDGRFSTDESWPFDPASSRTAQIALPWDNGIYREFPISFEIERRRRREGQPPEGEAAGKAPTIIYNFNIVYTGAVEVDGRALRVNFFPRPNDVAIDPANQRMQMDTNFNGRIESDLGEAENPSGKAPVFRVGSRYLAFRSADLTTGELVLEERPASDYTRFDALPGQEMPDFSFTDFSGVSRKLSDFRGKHVLLDFWGTWCHPCIEEMKHLDPLYEKYHPRGFEVIGMNMEKTSRGVSAEVYAKDEEKVRAFLAKAGHKWLQATQRSIERVALDVIHVNAYPTCILIGPDGKVISREARGDTLARLLEQHLPETAK